MMETSLVAAALAGAAAVPHCVGMCGPISAAACGAAPGRRAKFEYQAGRLVGYALLGLAAGGAGALVAQSLPARWTSAFLSWSLALGLAAAALRLLRPSRPTAALVPLRIEGGEDPPLSRGRRALPLGLGLLTAALPCGVLWAALLIAAGTGSAGGGALAMLLFGAVSGLGTLGVGVVAQQLVRLSSPGARRLLALSLALGAVVAALRPLPALDDPAACHDEPALLSGEDS